jgi:hypothetical protein
MADHSHFQPADYLAANEAETVNSYHAPSALAVASLIVGLASPIYLFGPLLVVLPLFGVAISILALRSIATSDGALIGRALAIAGLFLSVTSIAAVVSYSMITRQLRTAQAAAVGKEWISFVLAGDTASAFQLSYGYPPPDPDQPQDFGPEGDPYQRFLEHPSVRPLVSLGVNVEVRDLGTFRYGALGEGRYYSRRKYVIIPERAKGETKSKPEEFAVYLHIYRTSVLGMRGMTWRVTPVEKDSPST